MTLGEWTSLIGYLDGFRPTDVASGQCPSTHHLLGTSREDYLSTKATSFWSHIDDVVSFEHHILVVLDDDDRIA